MIYQESQPTRSAENLHVIPNYVLAFIHLNWHIQPHLTSRYAAARLSQHALAFYNDLRKSRGDQATTCNCFIWRLFILLNSGSQFPTYTRYSQC